MSIRDGEPRRRHKVAALTAATALALSACSSSPDKEPVSVEAVLDERGEDNIAPPQTDENNQLLEDLGFSQDDAAEITGFTLEQAIKLAKKPGEYPEALAEYHRHAFKSFIKPGMEDFEYEDTDREMLYEILSGNVEYTQNIITKLRISTEELLAAIKKFSKPNQLKKQTSLANSLLDGPVELPTDFDYDPYTPNLNPAEKASTLALTNETENRALVLHALLEIGGLAKTGEVTMFDGEVCDIDYGSMAEVAGGTLFEFTRELGLVSITPTNKNIPEYGWLPVTFEPGLLGVRPISEPLPGVEGDEATCTDELQESRNVLGAIINEAENAIPDNSSGKNATTKLSRSLNEPTSIDLGGIPWIEPQNYEGF